MKIIRVEFKSTTTDLKSQLSDRGTPFDQVKSYQCQKHHASPNVEANLSGFFNNNTGPT